MNPRLMCFALGALALSACDDTLFKAPTGGEGGGGDGTPYGDTVAFFDNNCVSCHGEGAQSPTLEGDIHASLIGQTGIFGAEFVIPGDPEGSFLYQKITDTQSGGGVMPPGGQRPASETDIVYDWIAACAPEGTEEDACGDETGPTDTDY